MIVTFTGVKGGQGKSTLAVRLGAWLGVAGHATLLVDLSPAATASQLLGHGPEPERGAGDLARGRVAADAAARATECPGLSIVPYDRAACDLGGEPGLKRRLDAALARWDFVLLDAPTGLAGAAEMAVSVADWALVPVLPDELSLAGLRRTLSWMAEGGSRRAHRARLAGIVINAVDGRSKHAQSWARRIRRERRGDTVSTDVRRDRTLRTPGSLARICERPKRPTGADRDIVALRRELLRNLIARR